MGAKLIIRVTADDKVEVKVEGLTDADRSKPKGSKLCEKITEKLVQDLGSIERRDYDDDAAGDFGVVDGDRLWLGESESGGV